LKKLLINLTVLFTGCGLLMACSSNPDQFEGQPASATGPIKVGVLKGPSAIGLVHFMYQVSSQSASSADYQVEVFANIDELLPKIIQGQIEIAAVPANVAAVLDTRQPDAIQALAVTGLGMFYVMENGDSITSVQDLRGRTILAAVKGASHEYALRYLLSAHGLDPEKDVTFEWKSEHPEVVASLTTTPNVIALLPQPFATIAQAANEDLRLALDLNQEWNALSESGQSAGALVTTVLVARSELIQSRRADVLEFMEQYRASVNFVNDHVPEAAVLVEQFDLFPAAVAQKAIPLINITFVEGPEMQAMLAGYLAILFDVNPQAVGGELPGEEFYFKR